MKKVSILIFISFTMLILIMSCGNDSNNNPLGPADTTPEINGIEFVAIPELNTPYEMRPGYTVTLSDYEMSTTEVTNAQYIQYLKLAQSSGDIEVISGDVNGIGGFWDGRRYLDLDYGRGDNKCWISFDNGIFNIESGKENWPIVGVTWYGAKTFAEYFGFDLPTEAEWQYAASGGIEYDFATSDGTINFSNVNFKGSGIEHPVEVASYPANPFGLYDMAGNVFEWCNDWYGDYPSGNINNPVGDFASAYRVLRGGSWFVDAKYCSSSYRLHYFPAFRSRYYGFRVVSH